MDWIKIEDKLPSEGQIIDIWNGNNSRSIFRGNEFERYVDVCNKDRVMVLVYMKVTHWKPISEGPYEQKLVWQSSTQQQPDVWTDRTDEEYELMGHLSRFQWRQVEK